MPARNWIQSVLPLALIVLGAAAAQQPPIPPRRPAATVVLVELDGFRWDYPVRDGADNLLALGKRGVWAPQGMMPGYPAESAPNQFTLVTGLVPGHHGIVADNFLDPATQRRFSVADARATADAAWYRGTPLWSLAGQQGLRAACLGWLGCAARIAGFRPDKVIPAGLQPAAEVAQILNWLHLPASQRPRLIVARCAEPGSAARRFGPDAPQTRSAVRLVDAEIGRLQTGLAATGLPIDLVVVSDRGFATPQGEWITLDRYADLSAFNTAGTLLYAPAEDDRARLYSLTKKATSEFFVYRLKNLPADLGDRDARLGDPVIFATGPYAIRLHAPAGPVTPGSPASRSACPLPPAVDGFDARLVPAMKAIFFAAGPDIVKGTTVAPFRNVNLYAWLAHLLGLAPSKNDGSLNILSAALRDNGDSGK